MAIQIGGRLGPYEILAPLGAGGMGEVYRARDTKIDRHVAIKILPEAFGSDPERVARFEREAKTLGALNHPHIAQIYGVEEASGVRALVMELVEGEDLARRLARGPLAVAEALAVAIQIAEAIEAAHEQGIIHRDLKPANVKLRPDGTVKVLDFGLAKLAAPDAVPATDGAGSMSPTITTPAMTHAGVILGTAAYMSPEQAKGAAADPRSDIFSFGVVLYEMLTGRRPFGGDSVQELVASVLVRDPDLSALPAGLNPRLHELLVRCLAKSPKKRWQAIGDVRAELELIAAHPHAAPVATTAVAAPPRWRRITSVVAASLATGVMASATTWWLMSTNAPPVTRFEIRFEEGERIPTTSRTSVAISNDGRRLAYVASKGAASQLLVRELSSLEARPVPGATSTAVITNLAFSPDGQWIAFYTGHDGIIKKLPVTGGVPVPLCPAENPHGLAWDGDWLLFGQSAHGIMRIPASGGEPHIVASLQPGESVYGPQLVNGGESLLFTVASDPGEKRWDTAQVVLQPIAGGPRKIVLRGGSAARAVPTGHLVYAVGSTLTVVPFDERTGEVRGAPLPVVQGVLRALDSATGAVHFTVSPTGSLFYVPAIGGAGTQRRLALMDFNGTVQPIDAPPRAYSTPRVAPSGTQLAVVTEDGKEAVIWIVDLVESRPPRRLTFGGRSVSPIWTPDGRFITYQSEGNGASGLYQVPADGSGAPTQLTTAAAGSLQFPESWSADGRMLLFTVRRAETTAVWLLTRGADGRSSTRSLIALPKGHAVMPHFSPDGKWIAYAGSDAGTSGYYVFVEPFPPTGAKYQVTTMLTSTPVWARDGRQLFFAFTNRIYRSEVRTTPTLTFGEPVELRSVETMSSLPATRHFDLMPDGRRLLVILPEGADAGRQPLTRIVGVLNWFEELKRLAPAP